MKRLTTNSPSDNYSQLMNYAYGEDKRVKLSYAGMRHGADLCEYISGEAGDAGLSCAPSPDDVMEGTCMQCDCVFGVLNNVAIQAAELRARLMMIEDILGEDYNLEHLRELVKAERRWIPVTERMPEEHKGVVPGIGTVSKAVLVSWVDPFSKNAYPDNSFVREGITRNGEFTLNHINSDLVPVAWMPQPKPYKPPKEEV